MPVDRTRAAGGGEATSDPTAGLIPIERDFFDRSPVEVAPALLGAVLVNGNRSGRIVEVEAYCGATDPAAHTYRGQTKRNAAMFGPPGHLYVYFIYDMHWCTNVVCGPEGTGEAVLLRALEPLSGLDEQYVARGPVATRPEDLCSGPAKLTTALGIDASFDGADVIHERAGGTATSCWIGRSDGSQHQRVTQTARVGIRVAADLPWRWYLTDSAHVSRR